MDSTDLIVCAKCVEKQKHIEQLEATMIAMNKKIQIYSETLRDYEKLYLPVTVIANRSSMGTEFSDARQRRDTIEHL